MKLKQSTAVAISFGPFVDKTDGVTLETGLVSALDHASTGIKLSKNGGALTIRHATVTASSYDSYGNYIVTLDTTDTNTLGTLRVQFVEAATCLAVWMDYEVVSAAVWDWFYGSTIPPVNTTQFGGSNLTAASGIPEVKVASIAANAITATAIASDAITAAKVADGTIDAATFAANAITAAKLDPDVATELNAAVLSILGTPAGASLAADVAAVNAKTTNLPSDPADESALEAMLTAIDDFVDTEVAAIKAKTDLIPGTQDGKTYAATILLMASVLLGKSSNGNKTFRGIDDAKDRVTATVDGSNNRTAITLDAT